MAQWAFSIAAALQGLRHDDESSWFGRRLADASRKMPFDVVTATGPEAAVMVTVPITWAILLDGTTKSYRLLLSAPP